MIIFSLLVLSFIIATFLPRFNLLFAVGFLSLMASYVLLSFGFGKGLDQSPYFNFDLNLVSLVVGLVFSFSLLVSLVSTRGFYQPTINTKQMIILSSGIILANNLFVFFLFWILQRSFVIKDIISQMRSKTTDLGSSFIFQHLIGFSLALTFCFIGNQKNILFLPFERIPSDFFDLKTMLVGIGFAFFAHGVIPFHRWLPDFLFTQNWLDASITLMTRSGILIFVQLILPHYQIVSFEIRLVLVILCLLTSVYWSIKGLLDVRCLKSLSYLILAQVALIMTALQGDQVSLMGAYLQLLSIGLSAPAMLAIQVFLERSFPLTGMSPYLGLAKIYPKLSTLFCLFGFTMIGVPLTASHVVEDLVINGLVHDWPVFGLFHILASCLNGILFFRIFFRYFLGEFQEARGFYHREEVFHLKPFYLVVIFLILMGLFPFAFIKFFSPLVT